MKNTTTTHFTYITSNPAKIQSAREQLDKLGIAFAVKQLDLIEPQFDSIEEIASAKAKQAFEILQKPVIVSDVGWSIPALNDFPGSYGHYVFNTLTNKDFLHMLKDKKDRTIKSLTVMVYKDAHGYKPFTSTRIGRLLEKECGIATPPSIPIDLLLCFRRDDLSFAQCREKGVPLYDRGTESIWVDVGKWLKAERRKH